jgi:hypothetical protein
VSSGIILNKLMAHLLKFRKGWENENLARFILSKFSFISQPATIADDLGADFYCTFFIKVEKERKSKNHKLIKDIFIFPKHSFAIQIKSNKRRFDITNKLEYFDNLEIPYFIGVINQEKLSISIYSGDIIPELFSLVGLPPSGNKHKITVKAGLFENREKQDQQPRQNEYVIPFFQIGEVIASHTDEELIPFIECFSNICLNYQKNIVSKKKHEFIFHDAVTLAPKIIAGSGSYQVFRRNFCERLAEVFYNLAWVCPQIKDQASIDKFMQEYNVYKRFYCEIEKLYGKINFLEGSFKILENSIKNITIGST